METAWEQWKSREEDEALKKHLKVKVIMISQDPSPAMHPPVSTGNQVRRGNLTRYWCRNNLSAWDPEPSLSYLQVSLAVHSSLFSLPLLATCHCPLPKDWTSIPVQKLVRVKKNCSCFLVVETKNILPQSFDVNIQHVSMFTQTFHLQQCSDKQKKQKMTSSLRLVGWLVGWLREHLT